MSEFMKRLSEAAGSAGFTLQKHALGSDRFFAMTVSVGSIGEVEALIDTYYDYPVLATDPAAARAFAAELGRRIVASGLKQDKRQKVEISADKHDDWSTMLDLTAKNGLSAEIYVYADRKTGKKLSFEVTAIGPDESNDLPSNDPLKLHMKKLDLLDSLEEAASVAKGHAEDVLAFRKLDPDFGKYR